MRRFGGILIGVLFGMGATVLTTCRSSGENDDNETKGGAVGFSTGEEMPGAVPSGEGDALAAPRISGIDARVDAIKEGEALTVSVTFEDDQADVTIVHFGIDGESTYYDLNVESLVGGSESGTLLLELYPGTYVPGYYDLVVSLSDEGGNTGISVTLPFVILTPEGAFPERDTDATDTQTSESGRDTDSDTATPNDTNGKETDSGEAPGSGPPFIMGYVGDSSTGTPAALVLVTPEHGEAAITTLTEIVPDYVGGYVHDYRAGRLAFVAASKFRNPDRGPIAVIDIDSPTSVRWAPIPPSGDPDYYYDVSEARPQILSDGRIVYKVVFNTVNGYDDFHEDQLALWDPDTDSLSLEGGLSGWLKSQPEVAACNPDCDMELGYQAGAFAVSPDDRYAYLHIRGMGVEMMMAHTGYSYFARWNLSTGETDVLAFLDTEANVWTVTGDNQYVVLSHDGKWKKFAVATNTLSDFDDYPTYVRAGQTSRTSPKIMKGWRQCTDGFGGVVIFDLAAGSTTRVIDPALYESTYKGINENVQMNRDASRVYFTASSDACTNYDVEFVVMSSPVVENNPTPSTLMTLPGAYNTDFFVAVE